MHSSLKIGRKIVERTVRDKRTCPEYDVWYNRKFQSARFVCIKLLNSSRSHSTRMPLERSSPRTISPADVMDSSSLVSVIVVGFASLPGCGFFVLNFFFISVSPFCLWTHHALPSLLLVLCISVQTSRKDCVNIVYDNFNKYGAQCVFMVCDRNRTRLTGIFDAF